MVNSKGFAKDGMWNVGWDYYPTSFKQGRGK